MRCGFIFVRVFFYNNNNNNNSGTVASLRRRHNARVSGCRRGWDPRSRANSAHEGKGAPFVQSGGSSPQIGTPPRRVGVAPPTVGLSNEGQPANRVTQPSNQEASGQGKSPSHLTRGKKNGQGDGSVWVCLA